MLIYIVRHGLTEWNKLKKLQGAADVPLAKEGILLAEKTGEALRNVKFDICFTSPLSRAKQTAEYVLGKRDVPIIPDKRIQEIDFGVLEGDQVRDADGNYIDPQIEKGFKSMAYSLVFRAHDKTLGENEISAAMKKIMNGLNGLGIELRS